jgi:phasin family protein
METQPSPANLFGELAKAIEQFKLPGLDAAAIVEARRKDIESLAEANQTALAGVQELTQKQGEILQKTLQQIQSLLQEAKAAGSIAQNAAQLGDLIQTTLKETLGDMRDLAELTRKSQSQAFGVVSERVQRNVEELRALLLPRKN